MTHERTAPASSDVHAPQLRQTAAEMRVAHLEIVAQRVEQRMLGSALTVTACRRRPNLMRAMKLLWGCAARTGPPMF